MECSRTINFTLVNRKAVCTMISIYERCDEGELFKGDNLEDCGWETLECGNTPGGNTGFQ